MLEQIKPAIREVNHIHAQVAGLEKENSALMLLYDDASLSSEAMRYQLAISRTAWQDAENERIEAEKRSAEVKTLSQAVFGGEGRDGKFTCKSKRVLGGRLIV